MNKVDLINEVAEKTDLSKKDSAEAVEAVFEAIGDALEAGDKVTVIGFGTFSISERAARTGRNPATGAEIEIDAKNAVKFKPGKELKEKVQ